MAKRYFEDLAEGERLNCKPVLITKERMIDFAREFDPWPFHTDEDAADDSIFAGIIASSLHTISACTKVVVEAQQEVAVLSGVGGIDEVKMCNPVRPGDILSVDA
jgi:acyl dehydratase